MAPGNLSEIDENTTSTFVAVPNGEDPGGDNGANAGGSTEGKAVVPPTVKYILGNEFCERFSFYGMRAILALYLNERLKLSQSTATEMVHLFIVAAYLSPLFGAFISDSYLGKYRTILYLSFIYCTGNWFLSSSALQPTPTAAFPWAIAGLACLALGSGGIKPCVASFGGDQIEMTNPPGAARDRLVRTFFSYFYFAINVGSAISTVVTPLVRVHVSYSAAFALPAVLMMVATMLFWLGSGNYVHQPPAGNVVSEVLSIVVSALWPGKDAERRKSYPTLNMPMPMPIPERHASYGDVANSPLLSGSPTSYGNGGNGGEGSSYGGGGSGPQRRGSQPTLQKKLSKRGSKRAIVPRGFVHKAHWLDPAKAEHGEESVEDVKLLLRVLALFAPVPIFWSLFDQQASRWVFQAERMDGRMFGIKVEPDQMQTMNAALILVMIPLFDQLIYPACEKLGVSIRPIRRMVTGMALGAISFALSGLLQIWIEARAAEPGPSMASPVRGLLGVIGGNLGGAGNLTSMTSPVVDAWGSNLLVPVYSSSGHVQHASCYDPGSPPCISLGWQVPQYVVMTAGEILFSITGLELAYSQAPASMTAVVQAFWCLTVAGGNLFTAVVVGTVGSRLSQTQEFFFFTVMCLLSAAMLLYVGKGFIYVESCQDLQQIDDFSSQQQLPGGVGAGGAFSAPLAVPGGSVRQDGLFDIEGAGSVNTPPASYTDTPT